MASLREKVDAELEQMDRALLHSLYHGVENILKQGLLAIGVALPSGAAWHRDLLESAFAHGIITSELRDLRPVYAGFKRRVKRFARAQSKSHGPVKGSGLRA